MICPKVLIMAALSKNDGGHYRIERMIGVITMPRRVPTVLTMNDIQRICYESTSEKLTQSGVISSLRPACSTGLRGETFQCLFDNGSSLEFKFSDREYELSWRENSGEWHEERYECLQSSVDQIFLLHFLRTDSLPYEAETFVLDKRASLVTRVRGQIGTVNANRDIRRTVSFGVIGSEKTAARHTRTDDMVGVVIDWQFADGVTIHCMYETVQCCAFVSPPPVAAPDWYDFFHTFNPSKYVKIADHLYLITFYASGTSGMEVTMLMDLAKMRAVGAVFGIDPTDSLRSYTFGAKGAYAPAAFIGCYTM